MRATPPVRRAGSTGASTSQRRPGTDKAGRRPECEVPDERPKLTDKLARHHQRTAAGRRWRSPAAGAGR